MKFNFKKIGSVIASAAMIGATCGFAAAANYPAPFATEDYSIVIGSDLDMSAATTIGSNLIGDDTTTGTVTGEKIKIARSSNNFNLNDSMQDVWGTALTDSDLPNLLADGIFTNKDNTAYGFEQTFDIGNETFTHFADSQYNDREPTLGFDIGANSFAGNYSLTFVKIPEADHGTDLTDFENRGITILGKDYYILDFKNSTAEITLLDSANSAVLNEGETTTIDIDGDAHEVSVSFITTDEVVLNIDGVDTEKMSATGDTYGNTYKMSDGLYVGVREINVQDYAGGVKSVSFSIGKGKLVLKDSNDVKINDKSIQDLKSYITLSNSGSYRTWEKLVIEWKVEDQEFLTPGQELVMPGFKSLKYIMDDLTVPAEEETAIEYSGSDVLELQTTIKDGDLILPLLYISTTTGNVSGIGRSASERLATSNSTVLTFNATPATNQYDGFVVTWNNSREGESYYLDATVRSDTDAGKNYTTIRNKITGDEWEDRSEDQTITLGNVILTINDINYTSGGDRLVMMTVNSGGSFHRLITSEGLSVWLPYEGIQQSTVGFGQINLTGEGGNGNTGEKWTLWMSEADKDGTLGANKFSFNITDSSKKVTVDAIGYNGADYETTSTSDIYESYVLSDLATKIQWDKSNSDQYSATVTYHGGESYANLYVAESGSSVDSDSNVVVLMDDEITAAQKTNNLIVVGGSAVNSIAAKLLFDDETAMKYGADFTSATGVGEGGYIVKTYANPYASDKIATLVAGYKQADTVSAANALLGGLSTAVDAVTTGPQ